MAILTIRNVDENVKNQLRIQAAQHGWSMEEEVRQILSATVLGPATPSQLGSRIHARFANLPPIDIAPRQPVRETPPLN